MGFTTIFARETDCSHMVSAKTLLKGAGVLVLVLVLVRLALWLLGVVVSTVLWAIQMAITLLVLAALLYGVYWAYTKFIQSDSATSRETLYER